MSGAYSKNPGNVTGGLKATIRNPRISESTKQSARERLHERGTSEEDAAQFDRMGADPDQDVLDDMNNPEGPATRTRSKYTSGRISDVPGIPSNYTEATLNPDLVPDDDDEGTGSGDVDINEAFEYETAEYDDDGVPQGKSRGAMSGQPGERRVLGGYKATLHNPRVSQAAKDHAADILKQNDAL